jgi:hypothetical protein
VSKNIKETKDNFATLLEFGLKKVFANSMLREFSLRPDVCSAGQKIPRLYRSQRFVTVFT